MLRNSDKVQCADKIPRKKQAKVLRHWQFLYLTYYYPLVEPMLRVLFLFSLASSMAISSLAQPRLDSLKERLEKDNSENRIHLYQQLIISLWLNYPNEAMRYAREALHYAEGRNNSSEISIANRMLGGVHNYLSNYDSALYYGKESLKYALLAEDSVLINNSLNNVGLSYYYMGSYSSALEHLIKSLNIKKKQKQSYGLGLTLNNMGLVYSKLNKHDKAREYFTMGLDVSRDFDDKNIALYSENNIAQTFLDEDNVAGAEIHFMRALDYAEAIDNTNWEANTYSGLGQVYLVRGNLQKADSFFTKAFVLKNEIQDKEGLSRSYYFKSKLLHKQKKFDSAIYYLQVSQDMALRTKSRERILENYDLFKTYYQQRKQYDSALHYQSLFLSLRYSIINQSLALNLTDLQLRIQDEEAKAVILAKEEALKRSTIWINFMVVITLITVFFALVLFRSYKVQKRLGQVLKRKNLEINNQKEEIEAQKEALQSANKELERAQDKITHQNAELEHLNNQLRSTVEKRTKQLNDANQELRLVNLEMENLIYKSSHDIKGPLVRLIGICQVALLDVNDEKAREYLQLLSKSALQVNDIFDRLKMLSEISGADMELQHINFEQVIKTVIDRLKKLEGFENIDIQTEIARGILFRSDVFLVETILYNMLENAIKFQKKEASEPKFSRVEIYAKEKQLIMRFTDNGIGIKQEDIDQIFNMFSSAALEHQSIGLGLYTVKQCVTKLSGQANLIKGDSDFTEFEIILPMP
ncbi:tetratricopeptide repeat protein [Cytophagales bacterium LB-30]|uniref:histidine kinase n=1 Tax=Shiella aurantiaca TaxID=3058365 RepID=A0ABT8F7J6_9BACT|nr:tetratricopeptide repeat protein [Shiella aurantiaca]MDN4166214.1 tetratricopeptide repeat protein [Shiella aurantiaca]